MRLQQVFKVIVFRIQKDLCFLRAAALTFTAALSVVPVFAVMFGIAKGFGLEKILEDTIRKEFQDQEQLVQYLINFGYSLLEHARGGLIAGIGVITLFYTVLKLLSTIESSLNAMWGVKRGRPLSRKIVDFLALILICPIFFVISSSLTVFLAAYVQMLKDDMLLSPLRPMMLHALSIAPYIINLALFSFLYMYMPNMRVKFLSALLAGVFAGGAFQILQAWYIFIQITVSRTGAIYGSFAAIPLFLLWLYFSWIIFLLGAEIVVLHQEKIWNPDILAPGRHLTRLEKKIAFLAITKAAVDAFLSGKIVDEEQLSKDLRLPVRLITELAEELVAANILMKSTKGIIPAQNPDALKAYDVLVAVEGENHFLKDERESSIAAFEKILLDSRHATLRDKTGILIKDVSIEKA
jgi:membrane protein